MRPRTPTDLAGCVDLLRRVYDRDGYPSRWPADPGSFLAAPRELAGWVAGPGPGGPVVGHVALHNCAAAATLAVAARATGRPESALAVVARFLVSPASRREGIGRRLLATAVADSHRRARQPVLDVAHRLTAAQALYAAAGWRPAGSVVHRLADGAELRCLVFVGPPPR